ncbi:sporangia induced hypothetical protein [Thraustotheca clavata]|uniref:Uncharacterized protein n=1 Tax=Thraustotheca clavata TaxID=74557 RepID=A0A1W0A3U0_9STRA|nr:sporangia induced hypothetical protein [Thraustotheca clavata]
MPVYSRADAAALNSKSMTSMELHKGKVMPVFVGEPQFVKLSKEANPGDVLLGKITFGKKQTNQGQGPGGFELSYTVPSPESKYKEPEAKSTKVIEIINDDTDEVEINAMRDFILSRLTKSIGKDNFQAIFSQHIKSYSGCLPVLQTQLHHFDHEKRRMEQLNDIVQAADTILNLLAHQIPDLMTPLGLQTLLNTSKEARKENDKTKGILIDALARKARALGDLNHTNFDTSYQTLQQWANTNDFKYIYCNLHHDIQKEHYGFALQRLQKFEPIENAKVMSSTKKGGTKLVLMNSKDAVGTYLNSLRGERKHVDKIDEGIPFFVPQLSKVKTSAMCSKKQTHLLFGYETLKHGYEESYRKQGNPLLYTDEKMYERQQLQNDKQIQACLGRFWETFSSIRIGKTSIDEPEYCDVFVKFFKALVPPQEFAVAEARKIVEKDWARDIGATSETMSKAMFYRSLFEVADIWTTDIGIDEYVMFLTKLFDRVTMTVFDQEKALWLTKFADLDVIKSSWEENKTGESVSPKRQAELRLKKKSITLGSIPLNEEKRDLPDLVLSPTRSFKQRKSERKLMIEAPAIDAPDTMENKDAVEVPKQSPTRNISPRKSKIYHDGATGSSIEQVRVAMPSIYLSPDLEVQKEDASAIKRRQRESAKLANRLRRGVERRISIYNQIIPFACFRLAPSLRL